MHFVLVYPVNEDLIYGGAGSFDRDETIKLLERLKKYGHTFETIESDDMPESEQRGLYTIWETQAVHTGNAKRYRVRNVFGSNRQGGGYLFGKQVPALVVFKESYEGVIFPPAVRASGELFKKTPFACDICPHEVPQQGKVSIRQFLESLVAKSSSSPNAQG